MGTGWGQDHDGDGDRRTTAMGTWWGQENDGDGSVMDKGMGTQREFPSQNQQKNRFVSKLHPGLPLARAFLPLQGPFLGVFPPVLRAGAQGACRHRRRAGSSSVARVGKGSGQAARTGSPPWEKPKSSFGRCPAGVPHPSNCQGRAESLGNKK